MNKKIILFIIVSLAHYNLSLNNKLSLYLRQSIYDIQEDLFNITTTAFIAFNHIKFKKNPENIILRLKNINKKLDKLLILSKNQQELKYKLNKMKNYCAYYRMYYIN